MKVRLDRTLLTARQAKLPGAQRGKVKGHRLGVMDGRSAAVINSKLKLLCTMTSASKYSKANTDVCLITSYLHSKTNDRSPQKLPRSARTHVKLMQICTLKDKDFLHCDVIFMTVKHFPTHIFIIVTKTDKISIL